MKRTISRVIAAVAVFSMALGTVIGCGPEEQPGGNENGNKTVAVTGVSLNKTSLSLTEGGSESLTATVTPDNATNKNVSWKSSDASVASVDNSGKVTAVKAGSATITVTTTDGSKTATCSVTVAAKAVAVTGVNLDKGEVEITKGESVQLTATISPDNATDKSMTWTSSDENVAKVDNTGKITAVEAGTATITVKTTDGGKTATCSVKVNPKEVAAEGIAIEPAKLEILEGKTAELKVVFTPADATNQDVTWKSSNEQVATVSGGVVTAIKEGKAKIFATAVDGGSEAFCEVTVKPDDTLKGIAFTADKFEVKEGKTIELGIEFTPSYAANKNVTFSNSNTSVVTIDANGTVTGIKEGQAIITATSEEGGFTATCTVIVAPAVSAGLYYNLEWEMYCDEEDLELWAPMGCAIDPDGNIYYAYSIQEWHTLMLSKNGVDKARISSEGMDYAIMSAAGGGYYYMPYTYTYERNAAVRRFSDNGDMKNFVLFEGSESYASQIRDIAVDSKGNAYIVGKFLDEYNIRNAVMFKVSSDGKVTKTNLSSSSTNWDAISVAVSKSGDIYAAVWDCNTRDLYLYKNGKKQSKLTDRFCRFGYYVDLTVKGDDVYACITEHPNPKDDDESVVNVYKNGTMLYTLKQFKSTYSDCIYVSSSGDIYVAGSSYDGNENRYYIWKNDALLYAVPSRVAPNSLFMKE